MNLSKIVNEFRHTFRKKYPEVIRKRRKIPTLVSKSLSFTSVIDSLTYVQIELFRDCVLKQYSNQFIHISMTDFVLHGQLKDVVFELMIPLLEKEGFQGVFELAYAYELEDDKKVCKTFGDDYHSLLELTHDFKMFQVDVFHQFVLKDFPSFDRVEVKIDYSPFRFVIRDKIGSVTYEELTTIQDVKSYLAHLVYEQEELEKLEKYTQDYIIKKYEYVFEYSEHDTQKRMPYFGRDYVTFHFKKRYSYSGEIDYYTFVGRELHHFDSLNDMKQQAISLWESHINKRMIRQLYKV